MERALVAITKGLLALALAVPLIVMGGWLPDVLYPHVVGKELYFRLVVEAAFAVWLYLVLRYSAYRPLRTWLMALMLGYLAVALTASLMGVSPTRSLWSTPERMQGWITLAHLTAFAIMLPTVYRKFSDWQTILNINLLAGFIVGLIGLWDITMGGGQRLSVTFGNPSFLASYVLVNLFVALAFLTHTYASRNGDETPSLSQSLSRSLWVSVICLDLLMLYYSGTRGAVVGLVVAAGLLFAAGALWGKGRKARKAFAIVLVFSLLAVSGLLVLKSTLPPNITRASATLERLVTVSPESFAVQSRLSAIQIGLDAFEARPVLGWGLANFGAAYDVHVDGEAATNLFRFDQAHNRIVEEMVTAGLIGLASYLVIWLGLGWLFISRARGFSGRKRLFTMSIGAGLVAYFVQNLFLFDTTAASVQLYLLFGFALYLAALPTVGAPDRTAISQDHESSTQPSLGRIRIALASTPAAHAVFAAVIFAATLLVCYLAVVGPYLGARHSFIALSGNRTGEERFAAYDKAVSSAPELSNYTVRLFIGALLDNWESLSEDERTTAIELVRRDAREGLRRVPKDWQLHLMMAQLYNRASDRNPELVSLSRIHTDAADGIAPGRLEVLQLKVQQHIYEGDRPAAITLLDRYLERAGPYLEKDSRAYRRLTELRDALLSGKILLP